MIKKIALVITLVVVLALLIPVGVRAGSALEVSESSVVINFPASLTFTVTAVSDVNITDIRLHYTVERMHHAEIVSEIDVTFTPSNQVQAQWAWDMRMGGGLPPGSRVDYWWTVTDTSGSRVETLPAVVNFEDNRYNWRNLTRGQVTLYWYQGDDSFAGELMDAVQSALSRLSENSGAELADAVRLYIYASAADLRGSMIFPQEWTGGVAFTEFGTIAIGIGTSASSLEWGKRAISHELTHLVIHQVTFNPYNNLPTWLDEGLAMTSEGELEPVFVAAISQAISEGTLISVRSLASPFSAYAEESTLGYAESYEVVNYLIDEFGREKMLELLNTFHQGASYDGALTKVYGFDMDGLNARWQTSLAAAGVR
jgi:hypothetical protein